MSEKLEKIIAIAQQAKDSDFTEIWTPTYIARGYLVKDKNQIVDKVVTLKNVQIFPIFDECETSTDGINREWLNIFEDQIISFTIIKW